MKIEKETKVVILQNGNAVLATQYVNGKKVNASTARCCPEDAFDFAFGAKLALERLLDCMGSAPETAFDWAGLFPVTYGYRRTVLTLMPFCRLAKSII